MEQAQVCNGKHYCTIKYCYIITGEPPFLRVQTKPLENDSAAENSSGIFHHIQTVLFKINSWIPRCGGHGPWVVQFSINQGSIHDLAGEPINEGLAYRYLFNGQEIPGFLTLHYPNSSTFEDLLLFCDIDQVIQRVVLLEWMEYISVYRPGTLNLQSHVDR